MKDRARSGFALMVVVAVVLGVLIGTRGMGPGSGGESLPKQATTGSVAETDRAPEASEAGSAPTAGQVLADAEEPESDFFAGYRLERSRARSRSAETLQGIVSDDDLSQEARAAAGIQLVDLSKRTEAETEAEALIRARGYADALVFAREGGCDVVVLGSELTRADAEQIGDIISRCLGVELSKITIIERPR